MTRSDCLVLIVDDDFRIREALSEFLSTQFLPTAVFSTIAEYLAFTRPALPCCLILDIRLPDISGLEFQTQVGHEHHPPIIFMTGHGDIRSAVSAIQRGAVDFLTKPFNEADLMRAVHAAIERDLRARSLSADFDILQSRFRSLTPREREVLPLVASGLRNKQAAAELGISEVTLQIHRGKIMRKMNASSLADLVRAVERLKIPIICSRREGTELK